MDSGTQGKPGEHSCLIQLHMEQDGSMPIKVTTAWLCALNTESVLLLVGFLSVQGTKKTPKKLQTSDLRKCSLCKISSHTVHESQKNPKHREVSNPAAGRVEQRRDNDLIGLFYL